MSNKKNTSTGIGFGGFIFLVFLTLKLGEIGPVQYWSWWWVTSPLWIPLLLILIIMLVIGFLITITTIKNRTNMGEQLEGPFLKDGSLGPCSSIVNQTKIYHDTGSYLWVGGDDQERLINLARSSNDQEIRFSSGQSEFDSPSGYKRHI